MQRANAINLDEYSVPALGKMTKQNAVYGGSAISVQNVDSNKQRSGSSRRAAFQGKSTASSGMQEKKLDLGGGGAFSKKRNDLAYMTKGVRDLDDMFDVGNNNNNRNSFKNKNKLDLNLNVGGNSYNKGINNSTSYNQGGYNDYSKTSTTAKPTYNAPIINNNISTLVKAFDQIALHVPNLSAFFEEFDVYDGRIFFTWELSEIFKGKVSDSVFHNLGEQNQKSEKLLNDTVSYKFLFQQIISAPDCPHRFKNNEIKKQSFSIYDMHDQMWQSKPQLNKMIQEMLDHRALAGGRVDMAFDELFKPIKDKLPYNQKNDLQINLTSLQTVLAPALQNMYQGADYTDFISYICQGQTREHSFNKVKFVAALNHLIIKLRPAIAQKYFKDPMPGMANYDGTGAAGNDYFGLPQTAMAGQPAAMQSGVMQSQVIGPNAYAAAAAGTPAMQPSLVGVNAQQVQQQLQVYQNAKNFIQQASQFLQSKPQNSYFQQDIMTYKGYLDSACQQLMMAQSQDINYQNLTMGQNSLQTQSQYLQQNMQQFGQQFVQNFNATLMQFQQNMMQADNCITQLFNSTQMQMSQVPQNQLNNSFVQQQQPFNPTGSFVGPPNMQNPLQPQMQNSGNLANLSNSFINNPMNPQQQQQQPWQQMQSPMNNMNGQPMNNWNNSNVQNQGWPNNNNQNSQLYPTNMEQMPRVVPDGRPMEPWLLELMNRICTNLKNHHISVQQAFQRAGMPENIDGVMAYRSMDFIAHCEREFRMMSKEASLIASHFTVPSSPNYVDFVRFSTAIEREMTKYEAVLGVHQMQLQIIAKEIGQRHSGVYKWFQQYMRQAVKDNSLTQEEFAMAINNLSLGHQVQPQQVYDIFNRLDRENASIVSISEIECLFKELNRRVNPNLTPEIIAQKIVSAFNGDVNYIDSELRVIMQQNANILPLEQAVAFFEQFRGSSAYYQQSDLQFFLDSHVRTAGKVELPDVIEMLKQTIRIDRNLEPNKNRQGIHQTGGQHGDGSGFHPQMSFAGFSEDGTSAVKKVNLLTKPTYNPNIEPNLIEDLQKACFIQQKTVQEYFEKARGTQGGELSASTFGNAIADLGLEWQPYDVKNFFEQMNQSQKSGMMSKILAKTIDEQVHWKCKKRLAEIHQGMLVKVAVETTTHNVQPLEMVFESQVSRQSSYYQQSFSKNCNEAQFREVLGVYGLYYSDVDMKFLASQYLVHGHEDDIAYQRFLEDVKKSESLAVGQDRPKGDPNSICNYIVKQLHHQNIDLTQYFSSHADKDPRRPREDGTYTQSSLVGVLGQGLQLCPDVCTEQQLAFMWSQIDTNKRNKVASTAVAQFVKTRARRIEDLKTDVCKQISEVKDFEKHFTQDPAFFESNGQRFPLQKFVEILQRLFVTKIDVSFLSSFYMAPSKRDVNANDFIRDVGKCKSTRPEFDDRRGGGRDSYRGGRGNDYQDDDRYGGRSGGQQPGRSHQDRQREADAKEALKILAKMSQPYQKRLVDELKKKGAGSRQPTLAMAAFQQQIEQHCPEVSREQQRALEDKYELQSKPGYLDLKSFLDDLAQVTSRMKETGGTVKNLDKQARAKFDTLSQQFEQGNVILNFVLNLKQNDQDNKGYLADKYIIRAINDTYKEMRTQSRIPKLSDDEKKQLLSYCHRDRATQLFSYIDLLHHAFGEEQAKRFEVMDERDLAQELENNEGRKSGRFIMPSAVQPTGDQRLGHIGQAMINSNINYEDALKKVMGPTNNDNRITKEQLYQALESGEVNLDQRLTTFLLHDWFRMKQNNEGTVSVTDFLIDVGLPPQTIQVLQAVKAKGKVLSKDELISAQKLMNLISRDLKQSRKKVGDVIEKYKKDPREITMSAKDFKRFITTECPQLYKDRNNNFKDDNLKILMHYLVREELGMVSYHKLYQALNMKDNEHPLQQDQLEYIRAVKSQYHQQLQQAEIPVEIVHLMIFMDHNQLSIQEFFQQQPGKKMIQQDVIDEQRFDYLCAQKGYEPKDRHNLIQSLSEKGKGGAKVISLYKLQQYKQARDKKEKKRETGFDQVIQSRINKISQWMQQNNYTTEEMHKNLDEDGNGEVDAAEFIEGLCSYRIPGLMAKDFKMIFQAIDTNNNTYLSLNEFSLYLQGAQRTEEERKAQIPYEIMEQIRMDIDELFEFFDDNKDGEIDKYELVKTFQGLGHEMTIEKAEALIDSVDDDGNKKIGKDEFRRLMEPEMQTRLLEQDDRIEDFRAMFRDADTDYSGYLTADEVYTVLLKNGIDLKYDELIELMEEFDVSGDAQLDIDEFVAMMNTSSEMHFENQSSQSAYLQIRKKRRLNVMDFLKAVKNLPSAFVSSIFHEKWVKENKLRPSDVFKAQIDLRTMTWKDMLPMLDSQMTKEMQKKENRPCIRPIASEHACEIEITGATGIPLPEDAPNFRRDDIVKRAVRIGIFNQSTKEYMANAVQVEADWEPSKEDVWSFKKSENIMGYLNPVVFRSTKRDNLDLQNTMFIFEFVIYYKSRDSNEELSCGWAGIDLQSVIDKNLSSFQIAVHGGSPTTKILMTEVNTNRKGFAGFLKHFQSKIASMIKVSFNKPTRLSKDEEWHMQFLPSTCLLQRKLILFVSGYRNHAGATLLQDFNLGRYRQPAGSVTFSCFPKIIDNIDILEVLVQVWYDDVYMKMKTLEKASIQAPINYCNEIIHKIYPVLFADEFAIGDKTQMNSLCFDKQAIELRKEMLMSALRGQQTTQVYRGKTQPKYKPIEQLTTFKPFNVHETNWDVWDINRFKQDQYLLQYQNRGKFGRSHSTNTGGAPSPPNQYMNQQQPYHQQQNMHRNQGFNNQQDRDFDFNDRNRRISPKSNNMQPNYGGYNQNQPQINFGMGGDQQNSGRGNFDQMTPRLANEDPQIQSKGGANQPYDYGRKQPQRPSDKEPSGARSKPGVGGIHVSNLDQSTSSNNYKGSSVAGTQGISSQKPVAASGTTQGSRQAVFSKAAGSSSVAAQGKSSALNDERANFKAQMKNATNAKSTSGTTAKSSSRADFIANMRKK